MAGRARMRVLLGLISIVLALALAELALRFVGPVARSESVPRPQDARQDDSADALVEDERLGFKPVFGGSLYAAHGALKNEYALEKPAGKRRLLFLGDSVTRRGELVAGLRAELGEACEYWNAGVEGYSTWQELEYYRSYLEPIQADHVVLTFHLNDYLSTPVSFRSGDEVVAVRARGDVTRPIPWLWDLSYLYRFTQYRRLARPAPVLKVDEEEARREIERAFTELAELTRARGAELTVLVLPWLRARAQWPGSLQGKHAHVVELLTRLGIRNFTFLEELEAALAAGETIQEKPMDPQHPSTAFGRRMARAMLARGFVP